MPGNKFLAYVIDVTALRNIKLIASDYMSTPIYTQKNRRYFIEPSLQELSYALDL